MEPILRSGQMAIYRIEEYRFPMLGLTEMFIDADRIRPQLSKLSPDDYEADTDRLMMSSSSYIVRSEIRTIIFDAGVGNGKPRHRDMWNDLSTPWLDQVSSVVSPADVDYVVCTHMHCDHVGWNTVADGEGWAPTFPNARYLFNEIDHDFLTGDDAKAMFRRNGDFLADSIMPVFDAGLADIIDLPHEICPGVAIEHAPGDTPGHMIARISDPVSGAPLAIVSGDAIHHVLQVGTPDLSSSFCSMSDVAEHTRRRLLTECADSGVPLLAGHVASHDLLHVVRDSRTGGFAVAT